MVGEIRGDSSESVPSGTDLDVRFRTDGRLFTQLAVRVLEWQAKNPGVVPWVLLVGSLGEKI